MITFEPDRNSSSSLYTQLYRYLREEILSGRIGAGERLPSLRSMAGMLGLSITSVKTAYDQLLVEGYVTSRPHSGFYAADNAVNRAERSSRDPGYDKAAGSSGAAAKAVPLLVPDCDPASFDFVKWKKCMASVLNENPEMLLTEADRQGEAVLREEIASYLYRSRGVVCTGDQVVICAGTQQLVNHIARILRRMDIDLVCTEQPGYLPVRNIFRDWGFGINSIPVKQDGIEIEKLPINIRTAVYICPQNQYPTGAVMPVGRRHQILNWAEANDSIIIEDDYNSELRYFGKPVPALQGLDSGRRVVYIGSFTSTLFPAVRISYMVLPRGMAEIYDTIKQNYDQTCSKTEQLTLAMFMQKGYYHTNLRRIRKLYSRKLEETLAAIKSCDPEGSFISAENAESGMNIILSINTHEKVMTAGTSGEERIDEINRNLVRKMTEKAASEGLRIKGIDQLSRGGRIFLMFYYNQIPIGRIRQAVEILVRDLRSIVLKGGLDMPSVYEVIRIKDGRPMFLKEHYDRLGNSLASLGLMAPFTYDELAGHIGSMISDYSIQNHNLRMEVDLSGYSVIYMSPTHYPDPELYETGVSVGILHGERKNPNIKMMDHELRDAADAAIKEKSVFEVLLADRHGNITEGSRSNVFFIKDGELYTPPAAQILKGVTRLKVLEVAEKMGLKIHEEAISAEQALESDAAFISGTSPGVLPIASIEGKPFDVNDTALRQIMYNYDRLLL
jgi:GntR family transcriptional regulator/MocR family aminotransferase